MFIYMLDKALSINDKQLIDKEKINHIRIY